MTAPLDAAGRVDRAGRPRARSADHRVRAVRRSPRRARVGERATARPHHPSRAASSTVIDLGDEPHELELDANPEWQHHHAALRVPVVHDAGVDLRARPRHRRARAAEADARRRTSTCRCTPPAASGRPPPTARSCRSTSSAVATSQPDGDAPCLVYGYGSYESSMPPWFSVGRHLAARPRLGRGRSSTPAAAASSAGAGTATASCSHKRNTFTDTIACVEHLVAGGWARRDRVAIRGGSAGGLLVGACMTMRPDLFAAVVAEVPFVDVVTTMSDPTLPLTVTEWEEWGDPRDEPCGQLHARATRRTTTRSPPTTRRCTSPPV